MKRITSWLRTLFSLALAIWASTTHAQLSDREEKFVVIKAGRVITLAGDELTDAEIVLVDGRIRLLGKDLSYPRTAQVIDARKQVVMPGMIHPRTRWELTYYSRSGIHGDRSAAKEIFLTEIDFEPLLEAGFTAACFYPYGTSIPGPGAIYRTGGKQDTRNLGAGYLRITMTTPSRDKEMLRDAVSKARKEIEKVEKARKEWEEKQKKAKEEAEKQKKESSETGDKPEDEKKEKPAPDKNDEKKEPEKKGEDKEKDEQKKPEVFTPPKIDPAVLPFVEWIRDKKGPPLLFELYRASDYRHLEQALENASELPMELFYLSGSSSTDFHYVIKDLGERKALVLLQPRIGQLPYTVTRYNLAAELEMAGCRIVLLPTSDSTTAVKQFRLGIADLVRAGLSREEALKSVTLRPAEALGIADRVGTIEKGKDADLIFLDGDPLGPDTRVRRVMTLGEIVWEAPQRP